MFIDALANARRVIPDLAGIDLRLAAVPEDHFLAAFMAAERWAGVHIPPPPGSGIHLVAIRAAIVDTDARTYFCTPVEYTNALTIHECLHAVVSGGNHSPAFARAACHVRERCRWAGIPICGQALFDHRIHGGMPPDWHVDCLIPEIVAFAGKPLRDVLRHPAPAAFQRLFREAAY